jgi:predicted component of type VI protein secretion system
LVQAPCGANDHTAIVHIVVETEASTFEGLGDANPTNVARAIAPHLIRLAETRAKARSLRDALNSGAALEELGPEAET